MYMIVFAHPKKKKKIMYAFGNKHVTFHVGLFCGWVGVLFSSLPFVGVLLYISCIL